MANHVDLNKAVGILKDPFSNDLMERFSVTAFKSVFDGWTYIGRLEYKNGDTGGEQKFTGASLEEVLLKMKTFMEEL